METKLEKKITLLDLIGNTPLVDVSFLAPKPGISLYAKAEWMNPGGSLKDRPVKRMLTKAIESGELTKDKIIIDSSSGNAGIAYSMIGNALGYRVEIVIPGNASMERKQRMKAHGTTIIETDPIEGYDEALRHVHRLVESDPDKYFTPRTRIVSLTHISNVLGTINPVKKLAEKAHGVGAVFIVDGAQGVPHMKVDVQNLGCDFYAFSGHKMLGPTGVGILWGKMGQLVNMDPFMGGGEMIEAVTMESSTWNSVPYKFEAGTPNFAQAVGLGAAVDYLADITMEKIAEHEKELTNYALDKLDKIEGLRLHGSPPQRGGVISFNLENIHPHDLAQFLNEDNIAIRVGHHCAQPLLKTLGETATARMSFYIYNDESDIDKFCQSLDSIREYF